MEIANRSLLRAMVEEVNIYTSNDRKYMIAAIPILTTKFAPSGSLKNKNIIFEQTIDVIPKINNGVFFDVKYISVIIL